MKKSLEGYLYNRIEKFGTKKYVHVGFDDGAGKFEKMLASLVPEVGMKKKVRLTIEILEKPVKSRHNKAKNKK